MGKSDGFVKKQKDEVYRCKKEITSKMCKELSKLYEKKATAKINIMVEAFVGLVKNEESVTAEDIKVSKSSQFTRK